MKDLYTPRATQVPSTVSTATRPVIAPQGVAMTDHDLITMGYVGSFHHAGHKTIESRCYACGVEVQSGKDSDPEKRVWVGHFGLSKGGRHVLWYSVHHCRNCNPWEIGKQIARTLGCELVAPPASTNWNARKGAPDGDAMVSGGQGHEKGKFCWCGLWHA